MPVAGVALAAAAFAAEVEFDPPEWNFGVRPQEHLVRKVVRLRPAGPGRLKIGLIQIGCRCLSAEILREEGDARTPAEIRLAMDTERFEGATRHFVFVSLREPEGALLKYAVTGWVRRRETPGQAEVFYPGEEPAGERFLAWWREVSPRSSLAGAVRLLPIEDEANYRRLRELERRVGRVASAPDIVAFVDGEIALLGDSEVRAGLAGLLDLEHDAEDKTARQSAPQVPGEPETADSHLAGGAPPVAPAGAGVSAEGPPQADRRDDARHSRTSGETPQALEIWIVHFSDCRGCRGALLIAERLARERPREVRLTISDSAREPEAIPRLFRRLEAYPGAPRTLPSMVAFVGDELLLGEEAIEKELPTLAARQLERGGAALSLREPQPRQSDSGIPAVELVPVVLAAMADGVNPCAFAAMVVLVSVLSAGGLSSGRGGLLLGGGAFCAGVFATYYLAGLALFAGAKGIAAFPALERVVFWTVWALAAGGALLSAADAVAYLRTGDPSRVRLKVPEVVRRTFAPVLRGRLRSLGLLAGGFVGGSIIALLEGICTGQMYLPVIQYMARTSGLRARGAVYLLVYNLIFVLPLVAILCAAAAGVHFQRLNAFLRAHIGGAKLFLAAVFAALAAAMLAGR